jgi:hypothetical protein
MLKPSGIVAALLGVLLFPLALSWGIGQDAAALLGEPKTAKNMSSVV